MFVITNTVLNLLAFTNLLDENAGFKCVDQLYLMSNREFSKHKPNAMPNAVAMVHLICKAGRSGDFVFTPVKGLTKNHRNVTLVQAKKFMKLDKVIFLLSFDNVDTYTVH